MDANIGNSFTVTKGGGLYYSCRTKNNACKLQHEEPVQIMTNQSPSHAWPRYA